jgi:hypothetical protein
MEKEFAHRASGGAVSISRLVFASESESIVFFVRTDPKPDDHIAFPQSDRSEVVSDSHNAYPISAFFKFE